MSKKIDYKFKSIYPIELVVNEPRIKDIKPYFENSPLNITINTATTDDDDKVFLIDLTIQFHPEGFEEPFFSVKLRHKFTIEHIDPKKITKFSGEDDDLYGLFLTMVSISYSTTRGYLAAILSNYRYKDLAFLPVIDPKILITNFLKDKKE